MSDEVFCDDLPLRQCSWVHDKELWVHESLKQLLRPCFPTILIIRDGGQKCSAGFRVWHVVEGVISDVDRDLGDEGREDGNGLVLFLRSVDQIYDLGETLIQNVDGLKSVHIVAFVVFFIGRAVF